MVAVVNSNSSYCMIVSQCRIVGESCMSEAYVLYMGMFVQGMSIT